MIDTSAIGQSSIKDMLAAQSPQELDALQQAGFYYRLRFFLRSTAWINLFWGGLTLWVGLVSPRPTFLSTIQTILGALIIIQSFLAIIRPRAWGLLALAILLVIVGLWNIFIILSNIVASYIWVDIFWLVIGLAQLRWAYRTYRMYRVFSAQPISRPAKDLADKYDRVWEGLSHPTTALSPELIMMQLAGNRHWWNGLLLPDRAMLVHKRQHWLMVIVKSDLIVVPNNARAINRDQVSILAQLGKEAWRGKIYPASFQQYLKWKGITDSQVEVDKDIRRKQLGLKFSRWFSILLAIIFGVAVVMGMAQVSSFR